jgi:hypothetical protein
MMAFDLFLIADHTWMAHDFATSHCLLAFPSSRTVDRVPRFGFFVAVVVCLSGGDTRFSRTGYVVTSATAIDLVSAFVVVEPRLERFTAVFARKKMKEVRAHPRTVAGYGARSSLKHF